MQATHWWYVGRRYLLSHLLSDADLTPTAILDIGCGPGANLEMLSAHAPVTGVDPDEESLNLARRYPHKRLLQAEANSLPVDDGAFDLVCLLDVLEHLDDEQAALDEAWRALAAGGHLIATVPAHPFLYSSHDRAQEHRRRYTRKRFCGLVASLPGADLRFFSGWNTALLPLAVPARLLDRLLRRPPRNDLSRPLLGLNALLALALKLDSRVALRAGFRRPWGLPLGLSWVAMLRKSPA